MRDMVLIDIELLSNDFWALAVLATLHPIRPQSTPSYMQIRTDILRTASIFAQDPVSNGPRRAEWLLKELQPRWSEQNAAAGLRSSGQISRLTCTALDLDSCVYDMVRAEL